MSDFKTLKGLFIKHVSSDPSNLIEGQIWYNTTTLQLKIAPEIGAWASEGNLTEERIAGGGFGTSTAAAVAGGATGAPTTAIQNTEEYNGSSWANGGDLGTGRANDTGAAGPQTGGVIAGGASVNTENYDGSSWSEQPNMNTARSYAFGALQGTQTAFYKAGGIVGTTRQNITEEYDGSSWTSGGNLNTTRGQGGGTGTLTAGLAACGYTGTAPTNATEEYNGTAWANGNNMGASLIEPSVAGTQAVAILSGGDPSVTACFEYDGTNWASSPAMANGRNLHATAGVISTGSLAIGGINPSGPNNKLTATEEYTKVGTARSVDTS